MYQGSNQGIMAHVSTEMLRAQWFLFQKEVLHEEDEEEDEENDDKK